MTVSELIKQLNAMPSNAIVVAEGYEDGFDSVKEISIMKVKANPDKGWWVGKYIETENSDGETVVFLNAKNKAENI